MAAQVTQRVAGFGTYYFIAAAQTPAALSTSADVLIVDLNRQASPIVPRIRKLIFSANKQAPPPVIGSATAASHGVWSRLSVVQGDVSGAFPAGVANITLPWSLNGINGSVPGTNAALASSGLKSVLFDHWIEWGTADAAALEPIAQSPSIFDFDLNESGLWALRGESLQVILMGPYAPVVSSNQFIANMSLSIYGTMDRGEKASYDGLVVPVNAHPT